MFMHLYFYFSQVWWPKTSTDNLPSKATTENCSRKWLFSTVVKSAKIFWKEFIFSKVDGFRLATSLITNSFTDIFQGLQQQVYKVCILELLSLEQLLCRTILTGYLWIRKINLILSIKSEKHRKANYIVQNLQELTYLITLPFLLYSTTI